ERIGTEHGPDARLTPGKHDRCLAEERARHRIAVLARETIDEGERVAQVEQLRERGSGSRWQGCVRHRAFDSRRGRMFPSQKGIAAAPYQNTPVSSQGFARTPSRR